MTNEQADKINRKVIEKIGLANAFNYLAQFVGNECLTEWYKDVAEAYDIKISPMEEQAQKIFSEYNTGDVIDYDYAVQLVTDALEKYVEKTCKWMQQHIVGTNEYIYDCCGAKLITHKAVEDYKEEMENNLIQ